MKTCTKCQVAQPLASFRVRKTGRPFSHCKSCDNARARVWAKANADRVRAHQLAYYERTQEEQRIAAREYRAANPSVARASVAAWRASNVETARAARRAWYHANPVKSRTAEARRRAVKLRAIPSWADHDLIADIYAYAKIMREAGVDCHVDHIVPLQGATVCGLHVHTNLQVLPAVDNIRKGNRLTPGVSLPR